MGCPLVLYRRARNGPTGRAFGPPMDASIGDLSRLLPALYVCPYGLERVVPHFVFEGANEKHVSGYDWQRGVTEIELYDVSGLRAVCNCVCFPVSHAHDFL